MFLKYKCLIILLLFLTGNMMTEAQELIAPTDTVMAVVGDTVVFFTLGIFESEVFELGFYAV